MKTGVELDDDSVFRCFRIVAHVALQSDAGACTVFNHTQLVECLLERAVHAAQGLAEGDAKSKHVSAEALGSCLVVFQALAASRRAFAVSLATVLGGGTLAKVAIQGASTMNPAMGSCIALLRLFIASRALPAHTQAQYFPQLVKEFDMLDNRGAASIVLPLVPAGDPIAESILEKVVERPGLIDAEHAWLVARYVWNVASEQRNRGPFRGDWNQGLHEDFAHIQDDCSERHQDVPSVQMQSASLLARLAGLVMDTIIHLHKVKPEKSEMRPNRLIESLSLQAAILQAAVGLTLWGTLRLQFANRHGLRAPLLDFVETGSDDVAIKLSTDEFEPLAGQVARLSTLVQLGAARVLVRCFGTVGGSKQYERIRLKESGAIESERQARRRLLIRATPLLPHRNCQEQVTNELVQAIFDPALALLSNTDCDKPAARPADFISIFKEALSCDASEDITNVSLESNSLRAGRHFSNASDTRLRVAWKDKWEASKTAWIMLPMHATYLDEDSSFLVESTKLATSLVKEDIVRPQDAVLSMVRFFADCNANVALEAPATSALNELLNASLVRLFQLSDDDPFPLEQNYVPGRESSTQAPWFKALERAAGSIFKLTELWNNLLIAFNERLVGHETAAALLLVMLQTESDPELRLTLWTDLHGGNLLRLLQPPSGSVLFRDLRTFTARIECDPELLQCMTAALCRRALTKGCFLHYVAVTQLRGYIWGGALSWNRKRLLKQLVEKGAYWEIISVQVPLANCSDASSSPCGNENVLPTALKALHIIAAENSRLWEKLRDDGLVSLQQDLASAPEEKRIDLENTPMGRQRLDLA